MPSAPFFSRPNTQYLSILADAAPVRRTLLTAALLGLWPDRPANASKLVADEWYQLAQSEQNERRELKFKTLPGLVQIKRFKTELVAPDFASTYQTFRGSASLVVSGTLVHPFATSIRDPLLRIGFLSHEALERTWRRLTATPLMLTEHELRQALPEPSFHWVQDVSDQETYARGSETKLRLETRFTNIRLQMRALPELMVMIDGYSLEDPTPKDLINIIEHGGVVDFTAAASWAHSVLLERPEWPEPERKKIIKSISTVLRAMRPPLEHGALARLNALTAIINAVAKPRDLEELLGASENVAVLMTSVGLSYYDSVREETEFDLPIHQIKSLPSLQEFLQSFTHALQEVRGHALAELVRLSFDPLDFRDAPRSAFSVSEVQKHAKALLDPLSPLDVNQLMVHVADEPQKQLQLLNFYVDARHAPVIATLLHWLHENPKHVDTLGIKAAAQLGAQIVPALLRTFLEPMDPQERRISRKMLLALPVQAQASAINALRGTGVLLDQKVDIAGAIASFESHEREALNRKSDLLEQSIFEAPANANDAVLRMNLLADLARTTPERVEGRAKEIFALLRSVAKQTMQIAPVHSERALTMFSSLPFGAFKPEAEIQLTLTKVELLEAQGKLRKALDALHKADPALTHPRFKLKYSQLSRQVIRNAIDEGQYPVAGRTLKAARPRLPNDDRFDILAQELFFSRYKLAFILGSIAILSMILCGAYVTAKRVASIIQTRLSSMRRPKPTPKRPALSGELEATQLGAMSPANTDAQPIDAEQKPLDDPGQTPATELQSAPEIAAPVRTIADDFADDFDDELDRMIEDEGASDSGRADGSEQANPASSKENEALPKEEIQAVKEAQAGGPAEETPVPPKPLDQASQDNVNSAQGDPANDELAFSDEGSSTQKDPVNDEQAPSASEPPPMNDELRFEDGELSANEDPEPDDVAVGEETSSPKRELSAQSSEVDAVAPREEELFENAA